MAAKEAEQVFPVTENEELREDEAPGDCANSMLIVSDSFENLNIEDDESEVPIKRHKSVINDIVRQTSLDGDSSSAENVEFTVGETNHTGDFSNEEDSGEQSDVCYLIPIF